MLWVVPDIFWCEDIIDKSEELTGGVLCARSLTALKVSCEKHPVVCAKEVHILVHMRQTGL